MLPDGLQRYLRALPAPETVTSDSLHLPPTSQQDVHKVLAVISCSSHPLFNRCALTMNTSQRVGWDALRDRKAQAAVLQGINALPDGLSPRQAAIAASFLASILWGFRRSCEERQLPALLMTASNCLPGVPDVVPILVKLVQHGIVCSDAAATVAPQEIDGLDFSQTYELLGVAKQEDCERVPPWMASPRYLALESLSSFVTEVQKVSHDLTKQVLERLTVAEATQQELVAWLLRAVVEGKEGLLLYRLMWADWPATAVDVLRQLLLNSQDAEELLMKLYGRWLQRLQSKHEDKGQLRDIMKYFSAAVMLYTDLVEAQDPSEPVPAPQFIVSATTLLLQFMEGPDFLLSQRADSSSLASPPQVPAAHVQVQQLSPQRQQQQQQRRRRPRPRNIAPAILATAEHIKELLLQRDYLNIPSAFSLLHLPNVHVLQEVVRSGLALRMFAAALRDVGGKDATWSLCSVLVNMTDLGQRVPDALQGRSSEVEAACKELGEQIQAKLQAEPALVDTLIAPGWNKEPRLFLVNAFMATLPSSAASEVTCRILLELASNLVTGIRLNKRGAINKAVVAEGLMRCQAAPWLLWESGSAAAQAVLGQIQQELTFARPMQLLQPVMAEMLALPELDSLKTLNNDVLTRPKAMVWQKELLWRIGQVIEGQVQQEAGLQVAAWDYVAFQTEHSMTADQLQQLFQGMQRQGYSSQDMGETMGHVLQEAKARSWYVGGATASLCTFLSAFLAHAATADPSTLPPDHTHQLAVCLTTATKDAAWVARQWDDDRMQDAAWALASCLVTRSAMLGSQWPAVSALMHPGDSVAGHLGPLLMHAILQQQEPAVLLAAVAWLVTLLRARPLKAVRELLEDTLLWRFVGFARRAYGGLGSAAAAGLLQGVLEVAEGAGLLSLARDALKTTADQAFAQNVQQQKVQDAADVLAISYLLESWSHNAGSRDPGTSSLAAAGGRTQGRQGVNWRMRLPQQWPGVDDVLQWEWWGAVQGWVRTRGSGPGSSGPLLKERNGPKDKGDVVIAAEPSAAVSDESANGCLPGLCGAVELGRRDGEGVGEELVVVRQCAACGGQGGLQVCSRCQAAWYCSAGCQARHWKKHRRTCGGRQA